MDACKLPIEFKVDELLADLAYVENGTQWLTHPDYTVAKAGDWTAVALVASASLDPKDPNSLRYRGGAGAPTELLGSCPVLARVIASFRTDVHRARLMNLRPGTKISPHRDYGAQRYSLERGFIRVHIPIRTHERVHFLINGNRVPMKAGEAWYTNVCQPHAVENASDVHRMHLVLDMCVNDWVRSMLPAQSLVNLAYGVILRRYERRFLALRFRARDLYGGTRKALGDMGLKKLLRQRQ